MGRVGKVFSGVLFGIFGLPAYIMPVLAFLFIVFYYRLTATSSGIRRTVAVVVLLFAAGIICELAAAGLDSCSVYDLKDLYLRCADEKSGGGVLFGSIAYFLFHYLKMAGTVLILVVMILSGLLMITGATLGGLIDGAVDRHERAAQRRERIRDKYYADDPQTYDDAYDPDNEPYLAYDDGLDEAYVQDGYDGDGYGYDAGTYAVSSEDEPYADDGSGTVHPRQRSSEYFRSLQDSRRRRREDKERRRKLAREELEARRILRPEPEQKNVWDGVTYDTYLEREPAPEDVPAPVPDGVESAAAEPEPVYEPQDMHELTAPELTEEIVIAPEDMPVHADPDDGREHMIHLPEYSLQAAAKQAPAPQETPVQENYDYASGMQELPYEPYPAPGYDAREASVPMQQDPVWPAEDMHDVRPVRPAETAPAVSAPQPVVQTVPVQAVPAAAAQTAPAAVTPLPPAAAPQSAQAPVPVSTAVPAAAAAADPDAIAEKAKQDANNATIGAGGAEQIRPDPVEPKKPAYRHVKYKAPATALLERRENKGGDTEQELRETAARLQETLQTFGVNVTITDISQGPAVTRYELVPDQGVKVSRIVSLQDDIKMHLAATDIRIEAPIPGKNAIGIEIPNRTNSVVSLRDILETKEFREFPGKMAFPVGKDIAGHPVIFDIAKMPHVLIAGATGSGKSVCINTIIMGILFSASPEEVKMVMIDPKIVELSVYNRIPHLLSPVVTDPKKAAGALNWAVAEMTERYKKFADAAVRDLRGYNDKMSREHPDDPTMRMPQILIIVDELADLMMVSASEVETAICRLAQLARAAGIHLVIATQRPSVDVITGLIKANMPSRIAFAVTSGVDSRTILDMVGAEKLLGKGDMLFYPQGYSKPARVQGCFVSDNEVQNVVDDLKARYRGLASSEDAPNFDRFSGGAGGGAAVGGPSGGDDTDELFTAAAEFIIESQKASIGLLQRRFKIGFNRAARIMDALAEAGVVGEDEGTKARKILMTKTDLAAYLNGGDE